MRRELVGAGLATAVLVGGIFVGSAATAQTEGGETSSQAAAASGTVKDLDAPRERSAQFAPQDFVVDESVARVYGANRYATAVAIAEAAGWTWDTTGIVYIASGVNFPDALAVGPSIPDDGPLLLVRQNEIHPDTAAALKELQPCFVMVVGGTTAVSDKVFKDLKAHTHPELCTETPVP